MHRLDHHTDFIYSLHVIERAQVVMSGAGNGMMLCHSLVDGSVLYGLGANEGAVRCIASHDGHHLVAAGDDGKMIIYAYE